MTGSPIEAPQAVKAWGVENFFDDFAKGTFRDDIHSLS